MPPTSGLGDRDRGAAASAVPNRTTLAMAIQTNAEVAAGLCVQGRVRDGQPVTVGVPLAEGQLPCAAPVRLVNASGVAVLIQTQPLAHWTDGSVQWLLVDFLLDASWAEQTPIELRRGVPGQDEATRPALTVRPLSDRTVIETGAASFEIPLAGRSLLERAALASRQLSPAPALECVLTDAQGRVRRPQWERFALECAGPVCATVRRSGGVPGLGAVRLAARLSFFANSGLVKVELTLHNPRRARHRGGLWDLGDKGSVLFRDLSVKLRLGSDFACRGLTWSPEPGQPVGRTTSGEFELHQGSSGGENYQSQNHVNRHGRVPITGRGYRLCLGQREVEGLRASPVLCVAGEGVCLAAAVPEFWQQFPKTLAFRRGELSVGLFPAEFGDLFELQGGEQKTHVFWLDLSQGPADPNRLAWVHEPALVLPEREVFVRSGVVPCLGQDRLAPAAQLDQYLADVGEGPKSLFSRREVIDEYGWRNFGEVFADHEGEHYRGLRPVISHYNNQYDQVLGLLLQAMRTGRKQWWQLADELARHVIDIDIYHTTEDKPAYNGGLFWFTDHYQTAATATHRTYSRANAHHTAYGGGPSTQHLFTTGLVYYYYLTGQPAAKAAVLELADWVIASDDGRRTLLAVIDDGPTGLATCTASPDYHGPGRGAGNAINALVDAWLLSGNRRYLETAEAFLRRTIHPADDIAGRDLLDAEKWWSYTVYLSVLDRYLVLKARAGELDAMYAYARASLLVYARWMLEHERPYLDHKDKLEYVTEAWPAHDLRKANVLRLAAKYADDALAAGLLEKGTALADRAWSDLSGFASCRSARAVAVLMVEGTKDAFFRSLTEPAAPPAPTGVTFGQPEAFVPQRQRVGQKLHTPAGLAVLASPRCWWRLFAQRFRPGGG